MRCHERAKRGGWGACTPRRVNVGQSAGAARRRRPRPARAAAAAGGRSSCARLLPLPRGRAAARRRPVGAAGWRGARVAPAWRPAWRLRLVALALPAAAGALELAALAAHVRLGVGAGHTWSGSRGARSRPGEKALRRDHAGTGRVRTAWAGGGARVLPQAGHARSPLCHARHAPGAKRGMAGAEQGSPGAGPKCLTASRLFLGPRSRTVLLPVGACSASWSKVRISPPACSNRVEN